MKFLAVFFIGAVSALCAGAAWEYRFLGRALDSAFTGSRKVDFGEAESGMTGKTRLAFVPGADLDYELYRQGRKVEFEGTDL